LRLNCQTNTVCYVCE